MKMIKNITKLTVKYNGRVVGYLARLKSGKIAFQYDEEWLKNGFSISPFSLPLSGKLYVSDKDNFNGLYGVFYDSLPDGWGELLVRRMLAKKGINADALSPLTRLTLISGNGLGGLTYEPTQAEGGGAVSTDLDYIAAEAAKILNDEADGASLDDIYMLGGSSGGARPKAHIRLSGEEWIVKFPCRLDPAEAGSEEYNANRLAQACGIATAEFRLFPSEKCSGYFGSKRFDRADGKRIHMLSLSSMLETSHRIPNLDYLHLFQVIEKICVDKDDLLEAYRRMCFNVIYGNKDDHGKNFAFIYDEQLKGYRLSPAYDLTRTCNKHEHEMTVNGEGRPTAKNLSEIAATVKLNASVCENIIADVYAAVRR